MRTSHVESRAARNGHLNPPMQFFADVDEQRKELEYKASVSINQGASPQFVCRFATALWKRMGEPLYIDLIGKAPDGMRIVKGRSIKIKRGIQASPTVSFAIACNKIGLNRIKRPTTEIGIHYERKVLFLDATPEDWAWEPKKPTPPPEPTKHIIEDLTPVAPPEEASTVEHRQIKMQVRRSGHSSPALVLSIPATLLTAIDAPDRIMVCGTPHHGFRISGTPIEGRKLNYKTGTYVYVTLGMKEQNISKEVRLPVELDAEVKDGILRVSGAPREWLQAEGAFRPKPAAPLPPPIVAAPPPPPPPPPPPVERVPLVPVSALSGLPKGNTVQETEIVKTRFQQALNHTRELKIELERRTGLKFRVTRDLRFVLDM